MKILLKCIKNIGILSLILIIWQLLSNVSNPLFIPKPYDVYNDFIMLFNNGMLVQSLLSSVVRITTAILISATISIPVGLLMANYKVFDKIIAPISTSIRYIPVTIFYPLLIMWLGIDELMKVSFLFVATFFYFLPTVIMIAKDTDRNLIDTAQTMGMNSFQIMTKVRFPYSLPLILESFIMMYGIGWTYIIVVETVNTTSGLGHIINLGTARGKTDLVFMSIIVILIINYFFDKIGTKAIKSIFKWKYARQID
jgi:NitT/TauT family transport system permease protein